jgi:hypothetical protein
LDIHLVDLPTRPLVNGAIIRFTIYWIKEDRWEGSDYSVKIEL